MASGSECSRRWQRGTSRARTWIQHHLAVADLLVPLVLAPLTVAPTAGGRQAGLRWLWLSAAGCLIPLIWRRSHPLSVFAIVMTAALATAVADFRQLGPAATGALLVAPPTSG